MNCKPLAKMRNSGEGLGLVGKTMSIRVSLSVAFIFTLLKSPLLWIIINTKRMDLLMS